MSGSGKVCLENRERFSADTVEKLLVFTKSFQKKVRDAALEKIPQICYN